MVQSQVLQADLLANISVGWDEQSRYLETVLTALLIDLDETEPLDLFFLGVAQDDSNDGFGVWPHLRS